jgi:hypothetical protein
MLRPVLTVWNAEKIADGRSTLVMKPIGQFVTEREAMDWIERYEPPVAWDAKGWTEVVEKIWERAGRNADGNHVVYRVRLGGLVSA